MPDQYVATDKRTGFEVSVTGDFPEHPDDRMRIARTTTLFTRLMSTLLQRDETQRRVGFRAIETQLELADALIRQDHTEVQRLVRETLTSMGVGEDQLRELAQRLAEAGGLDPRIAEELGKAFGLESPIEADADSLDGPQLDPRVMSEIAEVLGSDDDDEDDEDDTLADPDMLQRSIENLRALRELREAAEMLERTSDLLPNPDGPHVWQGSQEEAEDVIARLTKIDEGLSLIDASVLDMDPQEIERLRSSVTRMRRVIELLAQAPSERDAEDDDSDEPDPAQR